MKCARCFAELPSQSQFCLRCGTPVHAASPVSATPVASPAVAALPRANSSRPLVIAVAILFLAVLGLGARMVLTQKSSQGSGSTLVSAPGNGSGGALVQAPGVSTPGAPVQAPGDSQAHAVVQNAGAQANTADIDDYLRFLKEVEARKQALIHKELARVLNVYGQMLPNEARAANDDTNQGKDFLPNIQKDEGALAAQWQELSRYFGSHTPPPACVDLRNKYFDHMGKIQSMLAKYTAALNSVATDPGNASSAINTLSSMQGTASADADASARAADDALDDVCSKYRLRKEFDIKTDPSSSTSLLH